MSTRSTQQTNWTCPCGGEVSIKQWGPRLYGGACDSCKLASERGGTRKKAEKVASEFFVPRGSYEVLTDTGWLLLDFLALEGGDWIETSSIKRFLEEREQLSRGLHDGYTEWQLLMRGVNGLVMHSENASGAKQFLRLTAAGWTALEQKEGRAG